jgi:hypothetical protein
VCGWRNRGQPVPQKPFKSVTCSLAVAPGSTLQHELCSRPVDGARRASDSGLEGSCDAASLGE